MWGPRYVQSTTAKGSAALLYIFPFLQATRNSMGGSLLHLHGLQLFKMLAGAPDVRQGGGRCCESRGMGGRRSREDGRQRVQRRRQGFTTRVAADVRIWLSCMTTMT